ncbi:MAG: TlpA family protein disulfide reductase [Acidimicrobiia bacterium]
MSQNAPHRRTARRLTSWAAVLAVVAVACSGGSDGITSQGQAEAISEGAGEPTPSVSFALFDGTETTLASFNGTPVVLNFWASWCPSCVAEMSAAFRPVEQQLGDRVAFLGMNIQDDRESALRLLEETGVQWISAEDPAGSLYLELGGIAMPFTVFISAEGRIVDKHNGPLTEGQLRDRITESFGA